MLQDVVSHSVVPSGKNDALRPPPPPPPALVPVKTFVWVNAPYTHSQPSSSKKTPPPLRLHCQRGDSVHSNNAATAPRENTTQATRPCHRSSADSAQLCRGKRGGEHHHLIFVPSARAHMSVGTIFGPPWPRTTSSSGAPRTGPPTATD
jgi:hypothetical protein